MSSIIDRRLNGKGKSTVNRKRFMDRYKKQIKESADDALRRGKITDDGSVDVSVPKRDISEPIFHHGKGGVNDIVHPGNKEFVTGDEFERPQGGGGGGGGDGEASQDGEGQDDFTFTLTREEFLDIIFSDCELPNLVKRTLAGSDSFARHNAGYVSDGNPERLALVPTFKKSIARRIALTNGKKKEIEELEEEFETLEENEENKERRTEITERIEELKEQIAKVPFLDDFDTMYRNSVEHPVPTSKAVMFCVMDVSASMTQELKDIAKRYFLLLNLFLEKNYDRSEVVFISHHTTAKECDEEEFFYGQETGGTVVSTALEKMQEIIRERYPSDEWNIYGAQASDGDNWGNDSAQCVSLLRKMLPEMQYYSYIEIDSRGHRQALWEAYTQLQEEFPKTFAQKIVQSAGDVFPVFHELFKKTGIQFAEPVTPDQAASNFLKKQKGPTGP